MIVCFVCGKLLPVEQRVAITGHAAPARPGIRTDPTIRLHGPCAVHLAGELLRAQEQEPRPTLRATPPDAMALTSRESRVLAGIVAGETNRRIGSQLGLAEKTVKNIVTEVLAKLGAGSRTEAAMLAVRGGLAPDHVLDSHLGC